MSNERDAFLKAINNDNTDIVPQLVYADWLDEHGDPEGIFWRNQAVITRDYPCGIIQDGKHDRLIGHAVRDGCGGLVGLEYNSHPGCGELVGRFGPASRFLIFHGSGEIVGGVLGKHRHLYGAWKMIVGENMMLFFPHGYGFTVIVAHIEARLDVLTYKLTNSRTIANTNNGNCWERLAAGDRQLRSACEYGPLVPWHTCEPARLSYPWAGELPTK